MTKYECIESFDVDKIDEDDFCTEEYITIQCGEVFESETQNNHCVKLANEEHCIVIDKYLFRECFEEVEYERT